MYESLQILSALSLLCREEEGLPDLLQGKFHVFATTSGFFWGYRQNFVFIIISDPSISSSFSALISMSINKKNKTLLNAPHSTAIIVFTALEAASAAEDAYVLWQRFQPSGNCCGVVACCIVG